MTETVCGICYNEPCPACAGTGSVREEHDWATEWLMCGNCYDDTCPACGKKNNDK